MRYCHASLSSLCLQPSYKFDKEGILLFVEKHENLFRVAEVFVERWCRLRGNLLFYLKGQEPFSEPHGLVVLDIAEIRLEAESPPTGPFYFNVIMGPGRNELILGASTATERDSWVQALHMASYSYMKAQADALAAKLKELQAKVSPKEERVNPGQGNDSPSAEIGISCDNLRCDANGYAPDTRVVVAFRSSLGFFWKKICQTEVVKGSANPCFLRTAHLCPSITDSAKDNFIRITVQEVKEVSTDTAIVLGHCELAAHKLLETEKLRLPVLSATKSTVGFVSLTVWTPIYANKAESLSGTPKRMSPEHDSKRFQKGHRRAHSLPPKLYVKLQLPSQGAGAKLLANSVLRTYRFHSGLGGDIMVHESMLESRLNNCIPTQLLRLWILEEKELVREVAGVAELRPPWHERYVKLLELHIKRVAEYATALEAIDCRRGIFFRKSIHKGNHDTLFLPVNLHVQRFVAQNDSLRRSSTLDIVTAGAFTAASLGFKGGGLVNMIEQLKTTENPGYLNSLNVAKDTILAMRHFRREIVGAIQRILVASRIRDEIVLIQAANELITKSQHIMSLIEPKAASDALSFYEQNRSASSIKENGDSSTAPLRSIAERIIQELRTPQVEFTPFQGEEQKDEFPESVQKDPYPTDTHNIRCGSPPSHYYSSSDEPEPIELTCVNMEAGLLALAGKVSQLCDVDDATISGFRPLANLVSRRKATAPVVSELSAASPLARPKTLQLDGTSKPQKDWVNELKPSLKKLHHSANCLLKTARLVHTVLRLQDDPQKMALQHALQLRRDACFSQALTTVITSLMVRLWCSPPDPVFLSILAKVGPLVYIEGLLTSFKAEKVMLGDMIVAVGDLKSIQFTLVLAGTLGNTEQFFGNISSIFRRKKARTNQTEERLRSNTFTVGGATGNRGAPGPVSPTANLSSISETVNMNSFNSISENDGVLETSFENDLPKGMAPVIRGSRSALQVVLPVPEAIFSALPPDCISQSQQVSFNITPVFFNVGFNEFVPIAEKLGEDDLEKQLNCDSFVRVHEYCKKFLKLNLESRKETRLSAISEYMKDLKDECLARKSKNMKILETMEYISRKMWGFRITACKSAKDRTGMAVTLEQCNFMLKEMDLADQEYQRALDTMRSEGTRIENCAKNIGTRKFAFQWLQLLTFPQKYRPPFGSFGSLQT